MVLDRWFNGSSRGHGQVERRTRGCFRRPTRRLLHECLEERSLLAAVVSSPADAGEGTLRAAIEWANANPGADTIEFAAGLAGMTVSLTSGSLPITDSLTILGPGADRLTIRGNGASRLFRVDDLLERTKVAVSIRGLTLVNGQGGSDAGGAVYNAEELTLSGCVLAGNGAANGGGIHNAGTLDITSSVLADNFAGDGGGGISNTGTLTVANSTLTGNSAGYGGGLANAGTLTVINSTLAGNSAGYGGGMLNAGRLTVANTLVAANVGLLGPDILNPGEIVADHNVIQDGRGSDIVAGADGNQVGVAALLDPAGLQDHGGSTPTIALLPGSPALNAGRNELAVDVHGVPLAFDQRGVGFPRVVGGRVDVGAWEALNRPPVANTDAATTAEDTAVRIAVLDNDSDPDGDPLVVKLADDGSAPLHGIVVPQEDGTLTYTPEPDYFGSDAFTYQACDPGPLCASASVEIVVQPVNDPPVFLPGSDHVVDEDAGPQAVATWATNIRPGPANEAAQAVWFVVTNDNPGLFSQQPQVSSSGALTYTPAPNAYGGAIVTVVLRDDGGVDNGGLDSSQPQVLIIIVNPVIDAALDIKPGNGDEIDAVNLGANGVLPIAIYSSGSDAFDVRWIDLDSIRLNGKHLDPRHVAWEDLDRDGRVDLMLQFAMSDIRDRGVLNPALVDSQILTLTAELAGGEALGPDLIGTDWLRLVPTPGKGKGGK